MGQVLKLAYNKIFFISIDRRVPTVQSMPSLNNEYHGNLTISRISNRQFTITSGPSISLLYFITPHLCQDVGSTSAFNNFYPETNTVHFSPWSPDCDPPQFGKSDPDPQHKSKAGPGSASKSIFINSGGLKWSHGGSSRSRKGSKNSGVEALNGEAEAHNGASEGLKSTCCRFASL